MYWQKGILRCNSKWIPIKFTKILKLHNESLKLLTYPSKEKLANIMYSTPFWKMGCSGKKKQYTPCLLLHKYPEKATLAMLHIEYNTALVKMKELTV